MGTFRMYRELGSPPVCHGPFVYLEIGEPHIPFPEAVV